jgi:hypothetical protein
MPEAIGELLLAGVAAAGVEGVAGFGLASTSLAIGSSSISLASIVGAGSLLASPVGLSCVLNCNDRQRE